MGFYINPEDGRTKEQWLRDEATALIPASQVLPLFDDDSSALPVCLVDNGLFTAAGIAYDKTEAIAFLRYDTRAKKWYKVARSKLNQFLPASMKVDCR